MSYFNCTTSYNIILLEVTYTIEVVSKRWHNLILF